VMARGNILASAAFDHKSDERVEDLVDPELVLYKSDGETPKLEHLSKATIEIPVTHEMAPESKLVVFYIRPDGEVVSDHLTFRVDRCLPNKVELRWNEKVAAPGSKIGLKVKAAPKSVCGLRAVDTSVDLLRPRHQLTADQVLLALERFQIFDYQSPSQSTDNNFCLRHQPSKNEDGDSKYDFIEDSRSHALTSFDRSGLVVLSDLRVFTFPCRTVDNVFGYSERLLPLSEETAEQVDAAVTDVPIPSTLMAERKKSFSGSRDHFPETWLWSLEAVDETGELELKDLDVPDSLTEWVGSAVCSSPLAGLGLSSSQPLIASQPFFLDFTLPYSIKMGEILPLSVSIFNQKQYPLPIRVIVKESAAFEVEGEKEKSLCLEEQGKEVVIFHLDFSKLGDVNVTILARVDSCFPGACGPDTLLLVRDTIVKQIRVEPEGFPVEETKNWYLCGESEAANATHSLSLPEDVVPDSARAWVTVFGDLLGPSIQGLETLETWSMDCGVQNMNALVPNIFILQYLSSTNQLTPELKAELIHKVENGFQIELHCQHEDGSFSSFGANKESSMWMTALVIKSFGQSLPFISLNEGGWQEGVRWITGKQMESGCFPNVGRVLMPRYQGNEEGEEGSNAELSAYVLISLLESGGSVEDKVIKRTLQCLKGSPNPSTFALALITYAFVLAGETELGGTYLDELLQRATEGDGLLFWHASTDDELMTFPKYSYFRSSRAQLALLHTYLESSDAMDMEITSYGILSLLKMGRKGDTARALSAVRWLISKRNSNGGFNSPQWCWVLQATAMVLQSLVLYASHVGLGEVAMDIQLSSSGWEHAFHLTNANRLVQQMTSIASLPHHLQISSFGSGCTLIQATLRYSVFREPKKQGMRLSVEEKLGDAQECDRRNIHVCAMYSGPANASDMAMLQVSMLSVKNPKPALIKLFDYFAPELQDTQKDHFAIQPFIF
ncbi:unnamed protein product, partial [Darwinula stevensoni]